MRPPLVLVPQDFGSLVFDRRTSRYTPFDRETTGLLLRTREEPIDAIVADLSPEGAEQTWGLFEHFYARGWFRLDGALAADVLPVEPPSGHLAGPLAVHLEVVAACNLKCTHCFAGTLPRRAEPLDLGELDALFGDLASLGSLRLGLTGGEPLLRPDLLEILDLATGHGLHPCLTTNATLLTEDMARELGRRELVWLNVSLEGASPESNDAVRGAGTFARVREKLRLLSRFTLAFTLTRANHREAEACAELAREVGAHTAVFRPLYPVGVARHAPELMPAFSDYTDALRRLARSGGDAGFDLCAIDPFSPQARAETSAVVHANNGCGAGNLVCSVSVEGQVNPCSFLGPEHDAGSLRERSFAEIWNESQGFRSIRSLDGEFQGGCRARALAANGSIDAADPWYAEWQREQGVHPLANVHVARQLPLASHG